MVCHRFEFNVGECEDQQFHLGGKNKDTLECVFVCGVGNPHFCITRRSGRVMNFSASCSDRCLKLSRRRRYGVALEAVVFE